MWDIQDVQRMECVYLRFIKQNYKFCENVNRFLSKQTRNNFAPIKWVKF